MRTNYNRDCLLSLPSKHRFLKICEALPGTQAEQQPKALVNTMQRNQTLFSRDLATATGTCASVPLSKALNCLSRIVSDLC